MFRERTWEHYKQTMVPEAATNTDKKVTLEELEYGPGIVSKLKNHYEESQKSRPSFLNKRRAASLENILDDYSSVESRKFKPRILNGNTRNISTRYINSVRCSEMRRAKSIETISRTEPYIINERPKSFHQDAKTIDNTQLFESEMSCTLNNRPRRISLPATKEKEKPPVEIVDQAKRVFEGRPEFRTKPPQHTGEVAAIVANFKNIIIQSKLSNQPLAKKPSAEKRKSLTVVPKFPK